MHYVPASQLTRSQRYSHLANVIVPCEQH